LAKPHFISKNILLSEQFETPMNMEITIVQWFPTCGTRTTSGTRRSSRWYTSTFCLLL